MKLLTLREFFIVYDRLTTIKMMQNRDRAWASGMQDIKQLNREIKGRVYVFEEDSFVPKNIIEEDLKNGLK